MAARPLLIIQMGVPPDDIIARFGEQGRWMQDAMGEPAAVPMQAGAAIQDGAQIQAGSPIQADAQIQVVRPSLGETLPPTGAVAGAIITGSWNMVTDREDWSELTAAWVREAFAGDVPLLGICYGHQLMAHALGGVVDYHPQGRELGCYGVRTLADLADDPMLYDLPDAFDALLSHEQSVIQAPEGARVLARSAHDPHQILRYSAHALSVQFHPEFSPALMQACITRRRAQLLGEGVDMDAMLSNIRETRHARRILTRFVEQVLAEVDALSAQF